jgi:ABC-type lipoprotein export system ATPase subunit
MRSIPLGVMALLGTAIALYLGHDLVLLDEPTQGLDAISSSFLASRLQEAATYGARIVIATHDPMIQRVASTQLCIEAGTLVCARDSSEYWKAAS